MLFDSLFCSNTGLIKGRFSNFLILFIFHEKSNRGHPFVSSKRLLTFLFYGTGSRRSNRKTKGKGKRGGNPSFCRHSANHGHSIEAGV